MAASPLDDTVLMEPVVQYGGDGLPDEYAFSMERALGLPSYEEPYFPEGGGFQFRSGPVVVGQTVTVSPPHLLGIDSLFSTVDLVGFRCCCPRECCLEDILDVQLNLEGILIEGRLTFPRLFRLKEYVREELRSGGWDEGEVRAEHLDIPPFLRILNPKHRIATIPRKERALCQWRGRQRAFEIEVLVARGSGRFRRNDVGLQMPSGFRPLEACFKNIRLSNNARVFTASEKLHSGAPIIQEWMFTRIYLRKGFVPLERAQEEISLEDCSLKESRRALLHGKGIRTLGELLQCSSPDVFAIKGAGLATLKSVTSWLDAEHSATLYKPGLPQGPQAISAYFAGLKRARNTFGFLRRELVEEGPTRLDDPRYSSDSKYQRGKARFHRTWRYHVLFHAFGGSSPKVESPLKSDPLGVKGIGLSTLRKSLGERTEAASRTRGKNRLRAESQSFQAEVWFSGMITKTELPKAHRRLPNEGKHEKEHGYRRHHINKRPKSSIGPGETK
jgi:hypothetical protein